MKTILCGFGVAACLALSAAAQSAAAPAADSAIDTSKLPPLQVGRGDPDSPAAALSEAQKLFSEGKDVEGAKRLRSACWSKPDTPEFSAEYLAQFAYIAVSLDECGKPKEAERIGRQVLAELDRVEKSKEFAGDKVRRKELLARAAYVHARVLGDHEAAADRLQEASDLDPEDKDAKQMAGKARENARQYGKRAKGGK